MIDLIPELKNALKNKLDNMIEADQEELAEFLGIFPQVDSYALKGLNKKQEDIAYDISLSTGWLVRSKNALDKVTPEIRKLCREIRDKTWELCMRTNYPDEIKTILKEK